MRFFEVVLSGAALVSAAAATVVQFTKFPQGTVAAGTPITLEYIPKDVTTTILLKKGLSTDLKTLETLTTTSTGGSFTWTPPKDLADGTDYAFEIEQEGADPNYSSQFALTGGSAPVASVSSSAGYSTAESSSAPASSSSAPASSSSAPASSAYPTVTMSTSVMMTTSVGTASASGSIMPSGMNSTISLGTPSATGAPSSTDSPPVENTGAASSFGINAAAVFGAIGAFAYLA